MAPRRKKRSANIPAPAREFKLRIPDDVASRIEARAKAEARPMNRIVINELAEYPELERYRDLAAHVEEMKTVLARYASRIVIADLSDELLQAVRDVLRADESDNVGELRARVAKMRVVLGAIEYTSRESR